MFRKIQQKFKKLTYFQVAALSLVFFTTLSLAYSAVLIRVYFGDPNLVGDLDYELIVAITEKHSDDSVLLELVKKACESGNINRYEAGEIYTYANTTYDDRPYAKDYTYQWRHPDDCKK
tara:strand:- start:108 stop:464 length:357 start_codon:yes stop_codon:yes gene_type:complete